ncbi:MAG: hypothetical protein Q4D27_04250 [Coriobacteriia bacterium]|nr:hypothetical protein [Coriobacteriia bacterium]
MASPSSNRGFQAVPGPSTDPRLNGIGRPRMTPAERAKIFMPFNPLKGFQEALREKEAEAEARSATDVHVDPFE